MVDYNQKTHKHNAQLKVIDTHRNQLVEIQIGIQKGDHFLKLNSELNEIILNILTKMGSTKTGI